MVIKVLPIIKIWCASLGLVASSFCVYPNKQSNQRKSYCAAEAMCPHVVGIASRGLQPIKLEKSEIDIDWFSNLCKLDWQINHSNDTHTHKRIHTKCEWTCNVNHVIRQAVTDTQNVRCFGGKQQRAIKVHKNIVCVCVCFCAHCLIWSAHVLRNFLAFFVVVVVNVTVFKYPITYPLPVSVFYCRAKWMQQNWKIKSRSKWIDKRNSRKRILNPIKKKTINNSDQ